MKERIAEYREKVDKKLVVRQRIFLFIISILIGIDAWNVASGRIDWILALSGFLLSTTIGIALSRMFNIFWHEEKGKVVSQLDTVGTILLILYIGLEVGRTWIFQHWLAGAALNAFGLIVLSGLLLGRFLGTGLKIHAALKENR